MMQKPSMAKPHKVIDGRRELRRNISGHFKDLRQKTKDGQLARIAINAQTIAIDTRHIPQLFPEIGGKRSNGGIIALGKGNLYGGKA